MAERGWKLSSFESYLVYFKTLKLQVDKPQVGCIWRFTFLRAFWIIWLRIKITLSRLKSSGLKHLFLDICPGPTPSLCSALAFHPSAVPTHPPPRPPPLPLSEANLICSSTAVDGKEVINTAAMTTGRLDTRLGSCAVKAFLGILSVNSSSPAFTWADINTPGDGEGAAFPTPFQLFHPSLSRLSTPDPKLCKC